MRSLYYVNFMFIAEEEKRLINNVLYRYHTLLCIDVWIWPSNCQPNRDYVFIKKGAPGTGCWSHVGRTRMGKQVWLE